MEQKKQESFGMRLRKLREELGLSMAELAQRSGLHPSTISRLESDLQRRPHMDTCILLARGLGISIQELAALTNIFTESVPVEVIQAAGADADQLLTKENLALLSVVQDLEPWAKHYLTQLLISLKQQHKAE